MTLGKTAISFVFVLLLASCPAASVEIKHATNLDIEKSGSSYVVTIKKPYYGADRPSVLILVPKGERERPISSDVAVVEIPLGRIVAGSTPAVACLQALDAMDLLVGLAGGKYVYTDSIRSMDLPEVASDGGMSRALDRELLLALSPDAFLTYLYGDEERRDVDFLSSCGVPVLFMAEYLEDSPLGRAEWIKFIGILVGKEKEAEDIFDMVSRRYGELEALGSEIEVRPGMISGAPFGGTWYVPRGDSWPVMLFKAAGGRYLWEDLEGAGTAPLDLEAVLARAVSADVWLNCGTWRSLKDVEASGLPARSFPPFVSGRIFNNDLRVNDQGGNDFYQSGVIRPDLILADLLWILHPSLLPDHEPVYYRLLR